MAELFYTQTRRGKKVVVRNSKKRSNEGLKLAGALGGLLLAGGLVGSAVASRGHAAGLRRNAEAYGAKLKNDLDDLNRFNQSVNARREAVDRAVDNARSTARQAIDDIDRLSGKKSTQQTSPGGFPERTIYQEFSFPAANNLPFGSSSKLARGLAAVERLNVLHMWANRKF
jgi:hypothetical protein